MATDRDEQRRQAQELEEIRRSFAEMGARMGSLFEPAEVDEPERAPQPTPPASEAATPSRSRWRVGALALLFLAGTAFGWALPKGDADPEPQATTATSQAQVTEPPSSPAPEIRTRVSVPETCVDTAELADEVISRLNRNARDNRLALALRDYTIASQACRREASP